MTELTANDRYLESLARANVGDNWPEEVSRLRTMSLWAFREYVQATISRSKKK